MLRPIPNWAASNSASPFSPPCAGRRSSCASSIPATAASTWAALGFDDDVLQQFLKLITKPSGLILLTGPTGSGKTTAIYSALYTLVQRAGSTISIATVEDPVEFSLPMVAQAQVNLAQEFTYPRALRSLMRQDPQVIMVGEIRDPETAAIAVQAGLTGHLVISTIHSGSTAGVFARLMNMEIEPFLLASSVTGVLGLRLHPQELPVLRPTLRTGAGLPQIGPAGRPGKRRIPPRRRLRAMPGHRLFRPLFGRRDAHGQPALSRRGAGQGCRRAPCSKWRSTTACRPCGSAACAGP